MEAAKAQNWAVRPQGGKKINELTSCINVTLSRDFLYIK
jgi:hypothetical protein